MARQTISWTQGVRVTATVDVADGELSHWAAGTALVRTIDAGVTQSADGTEVSRMLQTNPHLRAALLQAWAVDAAQEQQ